MSTTFFQNKDQNKDCTFLQKYRPHDIISYDLYLLSADSRLLYPVRNLYAYILLRALSTCYC